jgi:hypothetical protein
MTREHNSRPANNEERPHAKRRPAKVKTRAALQSWAMNSRTEEEDDAATHIERNGEAPTSSHDHQQLVSSLPTLPASSSDVHSRRAAPTLRRPPAPREEGEVQGRGHLPHGPAAQIHTCAEKNRGARPVARHNLGWSHRIRRGERLVGTMAGGEAAPGRDVGVAAGGRGLAIGEEGEHPPGGCSRTTGENKRREKTTVGGRGGARSKTTCQQATTTRLAGRCRIRRASGRWREVSQPTTDARSARRDARSVVGGAGPPQPGPPPARKSHRMRRRPREPQI